MKGRRQVEKHVSGLSPMTFVQLINGTPFLKLMKMEEQIKTNKKLATWASALLYTFFSVLLTSVMDRDKYIFQYAPLILKNLTGLNEFSSTLVNPLGNKTHPR